MAAAAAWPMKPEPMLDDPDYLDCLLCVLAVLRARLASSAGQPTLNGGAKAPSGNDR